MKTLSPKHIGPWNPSLVLQHTMCYRPRAGASIYPTVETVVWHAKPAAAGYLLAAHACWPWVRWSALPVPDAEFIRRCRAPPNSLLAALQGWLRTSDLDLAL